MTVDIMQYMRPNGRQVPQKTDVPDDCAEAYAKMQKAGMRLAAEELTTGHVSLTIEDMEEAEDINIRVVANGPQVQAAIAEMLKESFA